MSEGSKAKRYHQATKHSLESVQRGPRTLDWANQPLPFKIYENLDKEELPEDPSPSMAVLDAIGPAPAVPGERVPDRRSLGRLLAFSLGITKRVRVGGGEHYFRAAPCTGALYHVDAYVLSGHLPDLPAGVYHFGPHDLALGRLRAGDFRGVVAEASGEAPEVRQAPVLLVLASTYWRNAWKYRARAWRHVFWDGGAILAQLLAEARADGWPTQAVLGFADAPVERVCGLDPAREGIVAVVPVGRGREAPPAPSEIEPICFETRPLSPEETDYPEIRAAHAATSLADAGAVQDWRRRVPEFAPEASATEGVELPRPEDPPSEPLEKVIVRRGSARGFRREPIPAAALGAILRAASASLPADFRPDESVPLVGYFVVVHAVEGVAPGTYRWSSGTERLVPLQQGELRDHAGYLALGQPLAADAAADVILIADLDRVIGALGERGYRAAQLEGGIAGGRIYLAAYGQRLGATGLTFFDDDVCAFFGLDPDRYGVMFFTAVGHV